MFPTWSQTDASDPAATGQTQVLGRGAMEPHSKTEIALCDHLHFTSDVCT